MAMTDVEKISKFVELLRQNAKRRTFGLPPGEKREAVRHGYLLALEEVTAERSARLEFDETPSPNAA